MKNLTQKLLKRIKCLFGLHGKGRWQIEILEVRFDTHAIEYVNKYRCEHCSKIINPPIDNE